MRSLGSARESWRDLKQYQNLRELRDAVRLDGDASIATAGGRSSCWKAFLLFDSLDLLTWPQTLSSSRSAYNALRTHFLRHLDNPDEFSHDYDPLSEDADSSPWIQIRKDEELRAEILQDVDRCMPEHTHFRLPETQRMMLDILFIFSKLNPDVSYRQGMHELLAPIVWVVEVDAIDVGQGSKAMGEDAVIKNVFDAEYIEHDAFALFGQVMQSAKNFYEQTTTSGQENPIVVRSTRIFNEMLPLVDEKLASHLQSIDILPQVFMMRWIRLLFGREFPFDETLTVWDVIFAEDTILDIVDYMCLAMLLRIRWSLAAADYNEALTLLLRYPEPEKHIQPQTFALDALYLKEHLDYHGGSYLVSKYTGKPLEQAGRPVTPPALQRNITTFSGPNASPNASSGSQLSPTRGPRSARNFEAVLQSTAKNIYARGESLGIGKAVRGAVDEVHKRAQEIRDVQTPSSSATWRQRTPRGLSSPSAAGKSVQSLEARSKQLGKLLEGAVNELWDYQKMVSEATEGDDGDEKAAHLEKMSVAIAKAQFVQVYLDDPNIPLPDSASAQRPEVQEQTASERGPAPQLEDSVSDAKTAATHDSQDPFQTNAGGDTSDTSVVQPPQPKLSLYQPEVLADPSTFEDVADSGTPPRNPMTGAEPPRGSEPSADTKLAAQTASIPEKALPRPRLEQSSFSWMLGQGDDAQTRSTSGKSSLACDASRNKSMLFGGGERGSGDAKEDRRGRAEGSSSTFEPAGEAADFDMGSLRHGKSRGGGGQHH